MSAIGNFDVVKPTAAMVQAYGALFAWKLSLHGVSASSTRQQVGPKIFEAINGHRDASSTACPGKYLYARIRADPPLAAAAQQGWSGRELESNLARTPAAGPRRTACLGQAAADGLADRPQPRRGQDGYAARLRPPGRSRRHPLNAGDWNRDGFGGVIMRPQVRVLVCCSVTARSGSRRPCRIGTGFKGVDLWPRSVT